MKRHLVNRSGEIIDCETVGDENLDSDLLDEYFNITAAALASEMISGSIGLSDVNESEFYQGLLWLKDRAGKANHRFTVRNITYPLPILMIANNE